MLAKVWCGTELAVQSESTGHIEILVFREVQRQRIDLSKPQTSGSRDSDLGNPEIGRQTQELHINIRSLPLCSHFFSVLS